MYDELIDALRYCSDNEKQDGCDECPYLHNGMCHTMLSDAAYAIEELISRLPKWISVKDRLPTEKGAYLTAYYDGYVCENEWHFIGETAVGWVNDGEAVRYWMKLPEPPKGE